MNYENVERQTLIELKRLKPQIEAALGMKNLTIVIHCKGTMIRAVESVIRTEVDMVR